MRANVPQTKYPKVPALIVLYTCKPSTPFFLSVAVIYEQLTKGAFFGGVTSVFRPVIFTTL